MRRRLYLMRHGAVSYFEPDGKPLRPDEVGLNGDGLAQAAAARELLAGVEFDRVLTSGLRRAVDTARIVAPDAELEEWPDLRELRGERLADIPEDRLEAEYVYVFRGKVPNDRRFLGGETFGELFERVLRAVDRLLADESWDSVLAVLHGAVNRAILSYALTGERTFLGHFEQAGGCVNVLDVGTEWPADAVVRAVNVAPHDLLHTASRLTTMETYWREFRPSPDQSTGQAEA